MKRPSLKRRTPRLRKRHVRSINRCDTPQDYIDAWLWLTLKPGFEFYQHGIHYEVLRVGRNRVWFGEVGYVDAGLTLNRASFLALDGIREALKAQPGTAFSPRRDTP